eukprot:TRINITY_DN14994_c1_g1_i2.p1 TRINITY_DN14994_c1_g1~~TRINITY_DN14994_c1_g1_i2.p1  ORF type:complete len:541 (+),score=68.08 TRINITY_DN14994_c1_g1_i2:87-1709(+)
MPQRAEARRRSASPERKRRRVREEQGRRRRRGASEEAPHPAPSWAALAQGRCPGGHLLLLRALEGYRVSCGHCGDGNLEDCPKGYLHCKDCGHSACLRCRTDAGAAPSLLRRLPGAVLRLLPIAAPRPKPTLKRWNLSFAPAAAAIPAAAGAQPAAPARAPPDAATPCADEGRGSGPRPASPRSGEHRAETGDVQADVRVKLEPGTAASPPQQPRRATAAETRIKLEPAAVDPPIQDAGAAGTEQRREGAERRSKEDHVADVAQGNGSSSVAPTAAPASGGAAAAASPPRRPRGAGPAGEESEDDGAGSDPDGPEEQVGNLLREAGLGDIAPLFREHRFDIPSLAALDVWDLDAMGIERVGLRKRLLRVAKDARRSLRKPRRTTRPSTPTRRAHPSPLSHGRSRRRCSPSSPPSGAHRRRKVTPPPRRCRSRSSSSRGLTDASSSSSATAFAPHGGALRAGERRDAVLRRTFPSQSLGLRVSPSMHVTEVAHLSPAHRAGVPRGCIVRLVDGSRATTPTAFNQLTDGKLRCVLRIEGAPW